MPALAAKPDMAIQRRLVREAMKLHNDSQSALADSVGCSQTMIWKLLNGKSRISVEMARRIHRATDGRCPEHEFRPDFFEAPEEAA
ncbi:transcriptional regulator [Salinicola peritrichatus]|uniref:transcriptional regulator n=1 Tax=Salinicola peritrichatus TaxID=1267424 RepID=UPI000DA2377A|nr:YdaS family helix-turn-helix protein [Salinicola peritrichatus]